MFGIEHSYDIHSILDCLTLHIHITFQECLVLSKIFSKGSRILHISPLEGKPPSKCQLKLGAIFGCLGLSFRKLHGSIDKSCDAEAWTLRPNSNLYCDQVM